MKIESMLCNTCKHACVCKYRGLMQDMHTKLSSFSYDDPEHLLSVVCKCRHYDSYFYNSTLTGSISTVRSTGTLTNEPYNGTICLDTASTTGNVDSFTTDGLTTHSKMADSDIAKEYAMVANNTRTTYNNKLDHELDHDKVHSLAYENAVYDPTDSKTIKSFMD